MSTKTPKEETLSREANELYWESDESVNQIGEKMGLSKGVLYGLIAPLPSGLPCPECGEEMVYANRTARDKGFLECPECGIEEEETEVQRFWEDDGASGDRDPFATPRALAGRAGAAVQRAVGSGKESVVNLSPKGRVIAGTALLGIAAGLIIGGYLRKR